MSRKMMFVLFAAASMMLMSACTSSRMGGSQPDAGIANPASVFCGQNGGRSEIRTGADGSQMGVCVFVDGSECDEWAFYHGECQPGGTAPAVEPQAGNESNSRSAPADEAQADGWQVYHNDQLGFSFRYPADAVLESADDPAKTLTVVGALVNDEHWPMIFVNFAGDREDFQPPADADLEQWLVDHNLLMGERQADLTIAGEPAIHTALKDVKQSYPSDTYFFAHAGQLYSIVILHAGNKQDWDLYNHFLESIQFD